VSHSPCSSCGGKTLYKTRKPITRGGGYAPNLLPGLTSAFGSGKVVDVVVCADCGLVRLFAQRPALARLPTSDKWGRV
jgi:DNA-directed RNA polymerase subunit RPC12/RpoP